MPNLFAILLPAVVFAQGPLPDNVLPKAPAPDKVVARVNGAEIRAGDVEALLWDWRGNEVTQDLITYQLILAEARRLKVEVKPTETERAYEDRLSMYRQGTAAGTDLDDALRAQGFTRSRLFMKIHTDLLVNRIVMREFRPNDYVRVSTAAYRPEGAKDSTPVQRAEAAHGKLRMGEPWARVVKDSDLDDESKAADGHLGWRPISAFPESSQSEIRGLKSGEFSKPVALPDGSVQLFLISLRGAEAKDSDAGEIQDLYLARARPQLLQRLRAEAKIERVK